MAFNMFPFTNLHNLNTDWILKTIKELKTATEQAAATVAGYAARLTGLEDSVVKFTPQSLTAGQKQTARSNIGAISEADVTGTVKYNTEQQLTSGQQATARGNISAAPMIGVVYYNEAQELGDSYKAQARENIGAAAAGDVPTIEGVVRYDESQSLNTAQKLQARNNIDAANADREPQPVFLTYENGSYAIDVEPDQILDAIQSAVPVALVCKEMGSYPNAPAGIPNLREGLVTELHVSRQGTSSDYSLQGYSVLSYNYVTKQMIVFRLDISLVSGVVYITTRFDDLWGIPAPDVSDAGKYLTINMLGDAVWSSLPVYSGGVA